MDNHSQAHIPNPITPKAGQSKNLNFLQKIFGLPTHHWQLMAVGCVLFIHIFFMPLWLSIAAGISLLAQKPSLRTWVNQVSRQRQVKLYRYIQHFGLIAGMLGIWMSFGQVLGVNVSICFLVLCLILKLWEMNKRRDAYVVLNLNLFVLAATFLWSQSLGAGLLSLMGLTATLFAFITLNDDDNYTGHGRLRSLGLLMLPALPLLFVLFLFVPRIPPLWSAPALGKQATTGISDSMSPGDFSNLSKSTELAFRVEFDGAIPNRHQLYWRAMIFSDFDGVTWRASPNRPTLWHSDNPTTPDWAMPLTGAGQHYKVILEPTFGHWLFGLEHSRLAPMRGLATTQDLTYRTYFPIDQQLQYQASHQPNYQTPILALDDKTRQANLNLPKEGNEKSRAFAKAMFQKSHHNPSTFINNIHAYINRGNYRYTLSPPTLRQNRIDEFLFDTQAGFCEHYASSFVFLMRAAGVPARVVTGYQGGELSRDGKSWEVRQMDAHAWAEVWLDEAGWVRIDPTAFVAPERIDDGMNAFTDAAGAAMFGEGVAATLGYQQFRLLQSMRRLSDQASYYWQRDIVGFDQENQKQSLWHLFNITNLMQQIFYLIGLFMMVLGGFVAVFLYRRRRLYHPFDLPIVKLSQALAKKDRQLAKATGETTLAYLERLAHHQDNLATKINQLQADYRHYRYSPAASDTTHADYRHAQKKFAKAIAKLKRYF